MIRRRLEIASAQPRRCRISTPPPSAIPSDDRDFSDDDLEAKLRDSFRAEGKRVAEAIRQATGGDIMRIVQEGLRNMSGRARRRVQSLLDHLLAGQ
jgi:hypothetical protein